VGALPTHPTNFKIMNKSYYLLTASGDRHEDHIPVGVFDEEALQKYFYIETDKKDGFKEALPKEANVWQWFDTSFNILKLEFNTMIPRT